MVSTVGTPVGWNQYKTFIEAEIDEEEKNVSIKNL